MVYDERFDEKGRVIYSNLNNHIINNISFDETGLIAECIGEDLSPNRKQKYLYRTVRRENGLTDSRTYYSDMTVLRDKIEYQYEFYPYSRYYLVSGKEKE